MLSWFNLLLILKKKAVINKKLTKLRAEFAISLAASSGTRAVILASLRHLFKK